MRLTICIVLLFNTLMCVQCQTTTNWSHRIVSKQKHPLSYWFSSCGTVINELIIDGKRFKHVRGISEFYLPVPNTNLVVFVVDEPDYSVTYHLFNMDTDEDIAIPASNSIFGRSIGSTDICDAVLIGEGGIIELQNIDPDAKSTLPSLANLNSIKTVYYLDIGKKAVIAEKTFYYDKAGRLIDER